jgi:hypothetical protein
MPSDRQDREQKPFHTLNADEVLRHLDVDRVPGHPGPHLAIRSERDSIFVIGWLSNPSLFGAVVLTIGLQMAVVYLEPLQAIFHTSGLTPDELLVSLGLPWVVLVAVEIEKWLFRRGVIYQSS